MDAHNTQRIIEHDAPVVGPLFRPLHLQLDELIDSWRELADTVAERAVAIGFAPGAGR